MGCGGAGGMAALFDSSVKDQEEKLNSTLITPSSIKLKGEARAKGGQRNNTQGGEQLETDNTHCCELQQQNLENQLERIKNRGARRVTEGPERLICRGCIN